MKKEKCFALAAFLLLAAGTGRSQAPPAQTTPQKPAQAAPYARMPEQAVPYRRFRKPYQEWYIKPDTLDYFGAARSLPDGNWSRLNSINIGFLGPLDADNPDSLYGIAMLHGAQLAIEHANAAGGYRGKPFALKIHDDLPLWGASSMEIVKMDFDEHVWAMLGSVDGASTHIALRATLKLEIPIVNTATSDPTETETGIQWLMRDFPDDRQQGYALADYVFNQLKLKRISILRSTDRYGRKGTEKFVDMARRIGREPLLMLKYSSDDQDFSKLLTELNSNGIGGLVLWGDATAAGNILKQMRAMGMKQPVFGGSRIAYPEVIKIAGPAAEGLVTVCAMDPSRRDPKWQTFRKQYQQRYHSEPDAYASYAYDGMTILIAAIRKAGLNRGRIMDALRAHEMKEYHGVSGLSLFDYTLNDIAPVNFGKVRNGKFVYWPERRTDWNRAGSAAAK